MILPDVNVLVYAYREDTPDHDDYRVWLENQVNAAAPFGLSDLVLSGVVRILSHPRIFDPPTPANHVLDRLEVLRARANAVAVDPGPRHWPIFTDLCRQTNTKGNLVADAYHAALAIESGSTWITTDRDFARFPGLQWRHPLDNREG